MSSVSVVVVIVGVVIAAITAASLSDGPKPPTPKPERERTRTARNDIDPFVPAFPPATTIPDPLFGAPPALVPEHEPRDAGGPRVVDPAARPRRLRAAVLLVASVVALGTVAAALIGATVLLGARLLDQALG